MSDNGKHLERIVYLLRHGETTANAAGLASGWCEVDLSESGRRQAAAARLLVERLALKPALIMASPLRRAMVTASLVNAGLSLPVIEDARLREQCFGDWEGEPWPPVRAAMAQGLDPPGGETLADFRARVWAAFEDMLRKYAEPLLVVSHGGVMKEALQLFGVGDRSTPIRNAGLYEVRSCGETGRWEMVDHCGN